jgi:hypothetical protein
MTAARHRPPPGAQASSSGGGGGSGSAGFSGASPEAIAAQLPGSSERDKLAAACAALARVAGDAEALRQRNAALAADLFR